MNAIEPISLPTYDGSGVCIHPSVLDFNRINGGTWRGFRYWMAMTPYLNDTYERPSLLCSNDNVTWAAPAGLTNPIAEPYVGATKPGDATSVFCNDPELTYDPANDRLICYYGYYNPTPNATTHIGTSGLYMMTYSNAGVLAGTPCYTSTASQVIAGQSGGSCVIVAVSATDWRMWYLGASDTIYYRTSTNGTSWSAPTTCTIARPSFMSGWRINHLGGSYDATTGTIELLLSCCHSSYQFGDSERVMLVAAPIGAPTAFVGACSDWVIEPSEGSGWDNLSGYRSTCIRDSQRNLRIWYSAFGTRSANGNFNCHIGYVTVPDESL